MLKLYWSPRSRSFTTLWLLEDGPGGRLLRVGIG